MAWKPSQRLGSHAVWERRVLWSIRLPVANDEGKDTNPEELLGAAHARCFSMALALELTKAGVTVKSIHTTAKVHFEERGGGWSIQKIDLDAEASISDMAAEAFEEHSQGAKKNCPVSRALSGVDIHLRAKLL